MRFMKLWLTKQIHETMNYTKTNFRAASLAVCPRWGSGPPPGPGWNGPGGAAAWSATVDPPDPLATLVGQASRRWAGCPSGRRWGAQSGGLHRIAGRWWWSPTCSVERRSIFSRFDLGWLILGWSSSGWSSADLGLIFVGWYWVDLHGWIFSCWSSWVDSNVDRYRIMRSLTNIMVGSCDPKWNLKCNSIKH